MLRPANRRDFCNYARTSCRTGNLQALGEEPRSMTYVPPRHPAEWSRDELPGLGAAAGWAAENEIPWSRDLAVEIPRQFEEQPPWNEVLGPVRLRGGPNGLVLRGGKIAAEWGNILQIDQTFS